MISRKTLRSLTFAASWLGVTGAVLAADWPTYRGDYARTAATRERVGPPLAKRWVFSPRRKPRPLWPDPGKEIRKMTYDLAFHVAVAGGRVFFASSADDKVFCLDAATGRLMWTAFTGGPVRVAPSVWRGVVLVGSDDGCAYAFDARNGRRLWRVRGWPKPRWAVGRGRVMSVWPVLSGMVVRGETAYFVAGLFPSEGVAVCAVNAASGRLRWRRADSGQIYLQLPHPGAEAFSGVTPQGVLAASDSLLFQPTGRNVPAAYDLRTGELVQYKPEAKYNVGGSEATAAGGLVFNGPAGLRAYDGRTGQFVMQLPGRRLAIDGDLAYFLSDKQVTAVRFAAYADACRKYTALLNKRRDVHKQRWRAQYDLKRLKWKLKRVTPEVQKLERRYRELDKQYKALTAQMKQYGPAMKAAQRWTASVRGAKSIICTGAAVFVGEADGVAAFDKASGARLWRAATASPARGLAAADGRLFVSLESGDIVCFAEPNGEPALQVREPTGAAAVGEEALRRADAEAKALLAATRARRGFAVVVGARDAALPLALARQSTLRVAAIAADEARASALRRTLDRAGAYGGRVAVLEMETGRLPLPDYLANLLVVKDAGLAPAGEIRRVIRPCGGAAVLRRADAGRLFPRGAGEGFARRSGPTSDLVVLTRGPLPGAGEWTHEYADAGQTNCARDALVRAPLGVLWFGEPGPARLINRHSKAPAPVCAAGRLFIAGDDVLYAVDAYNGAALWSRRIAGARRVSVNGEASNLAATRDSVYLNVGQECLRLDAETGETLARFPAPRAPGRPAIWGCLAVVGDRLFGSAALPYAAPAMDEDAIRALVRRGVSWDAMNKIRPFGPAVFRNAEEFERAVAARLSPKEFAAFRTRLLRDPGIPRGGAASDLVFALDRRTGERLWTRRIEDGFVYHIAIAHGGGRMYLAESPWAAPNKRRVVALDEASGKELWRAAVDAAPLGRAYMTLIYSNGTLLALAAGGCGKMLALNAATGAERWSKRNRYTRHPVVTGEIIYAEPGAFDLKTGHALTRRHPLTGRPVPWRFSRAYGCGSASGSLHCLFFRSGSYGFYDLVRDEGTSNWGGMRPGCWINIIAAGGLVLAPDGSSGCTCSYPLQTSIAFIPVEREDNWAVFNTPGAARPVKHLAINFGAPGDRRDAAGRLWLAFPRPPSRFALPLAAQVTFAPGGRYVRRNADLAPFASTDKPWLFASAAAAPKSVRIPLLGKGEAPAKFTVRLYGLFDRAARRVKAGGKEIEMGKGLVSEIHGVEVALELLIEFPRPVNAPGRALLCGLEIVRE